MSARAFSCNPCHRRQADVNVLDRDGGNSLLYAAAGGHTDMALLLLEHGSKGCTRAAHVAREAGHVGLAETILSKVRA